MSNRDDALNLSVKFSPSIRSFLKALLDTDWREFSQECVFFRDFEKLPERAPFDVDVMCNRLKWDQLITLFTGLADQFGLQANSQKASNSAYFLVMDIAGPISLRRHCFFEVRADLTWATDQFAVRPSQPLRIAITDVALDGDSNLPVPAPHWHCAFLMLQALRKSDTQKYVTRVGSFAADVQDAAIEILARHGFDSDDVRRWLASPIAAPETKVEMVPRRPEPTWKDRISFFCVQYLFFLPMLTYEFYTLHGPDGVGKTTTCREIEKLFSGLPLGLYMFHHSEGWKYRRDDKSTGAPEEPAIGGGDENEKRPSASLVRTLVRVVYRSLPEGLRDLWLWNSHFANYNRKFSHFLYKHRGRGDILLSDRYLYDVRIKYLVETPQPKWLARMYYRIHSSLVPPPTHAFMLIDDPNAITRRKQELTTKQIVKFIQTLRYVLKEQRIETEEIAVDSRQPRAIAIDITNRLLLRLGGAVIGYSKAYLSRLEAGNTDRS